MTRNEKDNSRRSRWIWEPGDVIIIKKGDEQPEKAPEQAKDELAAADYQVSGNTSSQSDENRKQ